MLWRCQNAQFPYLIVVHFANYCFQAQTNSVCEKKMNKKNFF